MHEVVGAGVPLSTEDARYVEQLRVPAMSLGTYTIPAGRPDPQRPHREDEVYVVTRGRAHLRTPDASVAVGPGSVLFVPAGEEHAFVDVTEDLTVIVVFAPAETTPAG